MINISSIRPIIRHVALGIAAWLLIVSCGTHATRSDDPAIASSAACQMIQHAMGETCVPLNPERIVTIDPFSLENVLALGLQPAGYAIAPDWLEKRDYLRDRLSDINYAGDHNQPSLERILALKPDLIMGLELESEAVYQQLAQIAPTVLFPFETSGQWKEILMQNAEALDKVDAANELLADYAARLDDFKAQLEMKDFSSDESAADPLEVSIIRIYPDTVSVYSNDTFVGTIIEDAGLTRPATQTEEFRLNLSKESLHLADADVMFVWSNETGTNQQQVQTEIDQLSADPLWKNLDAVQNNQVYQVPSYWIGSSILTAHAVIDDLFNYLLETQP
ncbi:MAG: iron-siderophore ABC transporter substrate-binding protein [Synechococcales bacterium]|nr:iron-siderophore ABC transporter substrate-binding protein [Synechococcales bacterium]